MTSQTEKDKRIDAVADWILSEMTYSEIIAKTCGEYSVCKRTAEGYVAEANAMVREIRSRQKEAMITRAAGKFERIHDKAIAREDCSAATGAVRELVKLLGLAEAEKQEVKHDLTDEFVGVFRGIVKASDKPA
jgi:hypothetical protein